MRRLFRRETDAECIERARKRAQFTEKWGKWAAAAHVILGIVAAGLAVGFGYCLKLFADFVENGPKPAMPQAGNLMWEGFVLGAILGVVAGYLVYKGAFLVIQGIAIFHGDKTCTLLVRYHDGIVRMMEKDREESVNAAVSRPVQEQDHENTKGRKHEEE